MSRKYSVGIPLAMALAALCANAAPPQPSIAWSPCHRETGFPFECGVANVPLDHDDPTAGAIQIALVRLPARDPSRRIGALFLNPGGPGGSGVDMALAVAPLIYTPEVRARFDIVGFDPRGVGRSTGARCFGTIKQLVPYLTPFAFPMTAEELALWESSERAIVAACNQRGSHILDHMSTADVARDLDLLRQAIGDAKLTYAGYSYGSFLGATYASLFPDKVRSLVVDGVLDPIAWVNRPGIVPFSTSLRSDVGAMATLNEFFRLCDLNQANCAFAPSAAARYAALAERLKSAPLIVTLPNGSTLQFRYSDLIANSLGAMYNSFAWPSFAQFLVAVEFLATPTALGQRLQAMWSELGWTTKRGTPYPNFVESFAGVACSDSNNPTKYSVWAAAAEQAEQQNGYFGRIWTWTSSLCATVGGPAADRYAGPFTVPTSNPVLIVGNLFDPATPYHGAQTLSTLLPNSALLTVSAWGHTSLFASACADFFVSQYLVSGALPPPGLVCPQTIPPFTLLPVTEQGTISDAKGNRQRVTGELLPGAVRRVMR